jgi:hypothetical protein
VYIVERAIPSFVVEHAVAVAAVRAWTRRRYEFYGPDAAFPCF